jgi:hypothetical protein
MKKGIFIYPRSTVMATNKSVEVIIIFILCVIVFLYFAFFDLGRPIQERLVWFLAGCITLGMMACIINLFPNVIINGNKIGIQYFIFWLKWICFDELVSISERGWRGAGPVWIVQVRRLGWVHRLYGLYYTKSNVSVFLIGVDMNGFQELVSLIDDHLSSKDDYER